MCIDFSDSKQPRRLVAVGEDLTPDTRARASTRRSRHLAEKSKRSSMFHLARDVVRTYLASIHASGAWTLQGTRHGLQSTGRYVRARSARHASTEKLQIPMRAQMER